MSFVNDYYDLFYKVIAVLGTPNAPGVQTEDVLGGINELFSADAAFVYEAEGGRLKLAACAYAENAPVLPTWVYESWFSTPKLHFEYNTIMTMPLRNEMNEIICVVGAARVGKRLFARNRTDRLSSLLLALGTNVKLQLFQRRIERLAFRDALTGAYNRRKFEIDFGEAIDRAVKGESRGFVLFFDLDQFKRINDVFGHDAGDVLLIEIARFLASEQLFDSNVYRFGGDEFVAFVEGCTDEQLHECVEDILRRYSQPWKIPGEQVYCTASIGIARFPRDGKSYEELVRASDTAMYMAKHRGKNTFAFFNPDDDTGRSAPEVAKEYSLRHAIANDCDEFTLLLHPIVDAKSGLWTGAEYLVRWNSPEYGLLYPGEFIPLCEQLGLMAQLGDWIVRTAIELSHEFRKYPGFYVGINTSEIQTLDGQFVIHAAGSAKCAGVDPGTIMFELPAPEDIDAAAVLVKSLREAGFMVAADGFGATHKSIFMLKTVEFDMVKVEYSLGARCLESEYDREFAKSLARLSHTGNTRICAEGVSNSEIKEFFIESGYDYLQGVHYAEPMPLDKFIEALERNRG